MQNSHCLLGLVVKGFWNLEKKHRLYIDNLTVVTLHYFSAIYKKNCPQTAIFLLIGHFWPGCMNLNLLSHHLAHNWLIDIWFGFEKPAIIVRSVVCSSQMNARGEREQENEYKRYDLLGNWRWRCFLFSLEEFLGYRVSLPSITIL